MSKVVTGKVRFSYANVWTPTAIDENSEKKYNISLIISKDDEKTVKKFQDAIDALTADFKSKNGGKLPKNFKIPLRDGDEEREEDSAYENCYFINASSQRQPSIVDSDREEILDKAEFYSGCYGRASVNLYTFNKAGNVGIAVGLNHLQKLSDGEHLGGGSTAEEDFDDDFEDDPLG